MPEGEEYPSFAIPCPKCESAVEHSLAWLRGRTHIEFYCPSCGHREHILASSIAGLSEALGESDR